MSKPSRFSDEQLIELLMDTKLKNNKQIAEALGVKSYGGLNNRLNQLRKNNALPKSSGRAKSIPKTEGCKLMPPADPVYRVPEPLPGTELLKFDDIKAGDKLLRNGKPINAIGHEKDKKLREKDKLIIKDRFGYTDKVTRKYFNDNPGKFTRDMTRETVTVFEKVAERTKSDRKAATVNPEFEAAVRKMEEENKARESKPSVEDLFEVPEKTIKQCIHFLQNCKDPWCEDLDCSECSDYKDAMDIAEACEKVEPFNLDMEMDDNTDPYINEPTDLPAPRFEPIDYTDSDWFAIPAKGTVEYRIWMETMRKIKEINDARDVVRKALEVGDRLPATEVDRYNKIVSRYQEEVGA